MNKFVIIIPSYKNSAWYERNIASAVTQSYPKDKFRIIYTDDLSPDNTGNLVEAWLKQHKIENVKLVKNTKRVGAMRNLYDMIHSCEDDEIIITLDGDDWLAHSGVLTKLNQVYSDPNVWMTFGSYKDSPNGHRGCCKPYEQHVIDRNSFRREKWRASHLRTFYTWLFKKINKEDFLDPKGEFLDVAWDLSFMFPMLEMAGNRHKYVHDILYIYNNENPIQDYKIKLGRQGMMDKFIRTKKRYDRI